MPSIINNQNSNSKAQFNFSYSSGYWDCSRRDAAIEQAQAEYNHYNANYETVFNFSNELGTVKRNVGEIRSKYDLLYELIHSRCEQFLTDKNVGALNTGLSYLTEYESAIDGIISQVNSALNDCNDRLMTAAAAVVSSKAMECDWIENTNNNG